MTQTKKRKKEPAVPEGWHRHANGGGLVQDTACVDASAHVGPHARVYGSAWVSGSARVYGEARVEDDEWSETLPQMSIGRWHGHMREVDVVAIGCQTSPVDADLHAWIGRLAQQYEATPAEILAARTFVDYVKVWRETCVEVEYE